MTPRERYLLRVYGITQRQYDALLHEQFGGCFICGKTPKEEGRNLAVDHNHKTREIRGLLCMYCNHRVIGRHSDPDLLEQASKYLRQGTGLFVPVKKKKRKRKKHRK